MARARPWIEAFAPATVSNLGPGFDCLGLALRGPGDRVRARLSEKPGVKIVSIEGDGGKLPREADKNTAGVAVAGLLARHADGELDSGQTIVCTVTGNGLKDPQWAISGAPQPVRIAVDAPAAAAELGLI